VKSMDGCTQELVQHVLTLTNNWPKVVTSTTSLSFCYDNTFAILVSK
jgi:hypothetical protein